MWYTKDNLSLKRDLILAIETIYGSHLLISSEVMKSLMKKSNSNENIQKLEHVARFV